MKEAFDIIREVKASVISTSQNNIPHSRIIDIMDSDEKGVYFLTESIKPFYRQIEKNPYINITVMNKDYVQVRLEGKVEKLSEEKVGEMMDKNPSLKDLFDNRGDTFVPFGLLKGKGEIFDLSGRERKLIRRRFTFGGTEVNQAGVKIREESCISCGACNMVCPFDAVTKGNPYSVNPLYCDECGHCVKACPAHAIELPKGM